MADPVDFVVKQLPYDLSSHGGLALVGRLFKRINLPALVDPKYPVQTERVGIANSDILKCYLALLTLGKNDFEAVEGFRSQRFVHQALGLRAVPSSATLRQRFDAMGTGWSELVDRINRAVLGLHINGGPIDFGALSTGHLPLDIDTFVMEQSDTHKEGVSYTYAGVDGYCPSPCTWADAATAWNWTCARAASTAPVKANTTLSARWARPAPSARRPCCCARTRVFARNT